MFAIFNVILLALVGALLASSALRAGDQTEIFRIQRAQQGFNIARNIVNSYYYEKGVLPPGGLVDLQSDGYAPLSLSEMALYSRQTGLTEAVPVGTLGWTYDRAVLAVQRASNVRNAATFLNQNNCPSSGVTAFSSGKSWCPIDVVSSKVWETRTDMAARTDKIRGNLQRTLQKFADFYSAHGSPKQFPVPATNPGELRALAGQAGLTSANCTGVYTTQFNVVAGDNYTYMVWDCADLFTPYGQPVTYTWSTTATIPDPGAIRLSAPVGIVDQTGTTTTVGVNFTL